MSKLILQAAGCGDCSGSCSGSCGGSSCGSCSCKSANTDTNIDIDSARALLSQDDGQLSDAAREKLSEIVEAYDAAGSLSTESGAELARVLQAIAQRQQ